MRRLPNSLASLVTLGVGLAGPVSAQPGPCEQVTAACKNAGFIQGGAGAGTGLKADCVDPIMQGIAQPAGATRPLPQVDPRVVAACKARHPDFGQGKGPTPTADVRHAPTGAAPQLATPVSPGAIASADTPQSGPRPALLAPASGSFGVSRAATPTNSGPTPDKSHGSWPMTCRISQNNWMYINGGGSAAHIVFFPSKGAASAGLDPGQCAFLDRAVEQSEPFQLCFTGSVSSIAFNFEAAQPAGSFVGPGTGPSSTTNIAFAGPGAALLSTALNGPPKLMNFMVHKDASNPTVLSLTLTSAGDTCWVIDKYGT